MKKITLAHLVIIAIFGLSACGTSLKVKKEFSPITGEKFAYQISSKVAMPDKAMNIFKARLDSQLEASGKSAPAGTKGVSQVVIIITTYDMRSSATKALLGIFAGKDTMISTVDIKDLNTNEIKNSFEVESFNTSAYGGTNSMIEDQADLIIKTLTGVPKK